MPNNVLYYDDIIKLCDAAGDYVRTKSLLDDLANSAYTSPQSVMILAQYYEGDIEILKDRHKDNVLKANNAWVAIRVILTAESRWNKGDADVFFAKLTTAKEYCDFRPMVREWARAELRKEEKLVKSKNVPETDGKKKATPKGATFQDIGELLDRYQKLILKRQEKKKN